MPKSVAHPAAEGLSDFFRQLVEVAHEPLAVLDHELTVLLANEPFFALFTADPEELLGRAVTALPSPPWNASRLRTLLTTVLPRDGTVDHFRLGPGSSPVGEDLSANARYLDARPLDARNADAAADGREPLVLLALTAARAEREQDQLARLAALVRCSDDAIIVQTPDGRITDWNEGAERIYGYPAAEAVGRSIEIIIPPDRAVELAEVRARLREGRHVRNFETTRRRKDGKQVPVSLSMSPVRNENGRVTLIANIERDMTRRYRIERELRDAKDAAERASRIQAEFLANVSHELRTPMNAIIGMTDLALDEDLSPDVRDYLQTVRTSAEVLLDLLNDVLDFSKLESGAFELDRTEFDLADVLDPAMKTLGLKAYEKGLELACDVDAAAPQRLVGDPLRLRQVITNLVGNAVKFTAQGEVVVQVRPVALWPNSVRLRFGVRDTGIGISRENLQRIFSPFTQVDASSTRSYAGTGLGLAICTQLVSLMGGRLQVESEPGRGSVFHFTAHFHLPTRKRRSRSASAEEAALRELEGLRVLVVDDNETNRLILEKALANWSMKPEVVADGETALEKMRQAAERNQSYPLVILDALMPHVDGFTVAEQIQSDPQLAEAIVLMLSSADRQTFRERCQELELSALLEKPVSQSDLLDTIVTTLGGLPVRGGVKATTSIRRRPGRQLKVLLAEDTTANQKVVQKILEKRGHKVQIAHNGREAIDLMQDEPFDLVLMDVQMPIMDGFQATELIRSMSDPAVAETPVVAMTAHAMRGDRERCLAAGMDAYLSKPVDARKLITLIESFCLGFEMGEPTEAAGGGRLRRESVMDLDAALARLGGDTALLVDMLGFFQDDAPPLLADIRTACETRQAELLERAAHSLKGLASNFSAAAVTDAAEKLQECGRRGDIDAAAPLVETVEQHTQSLLDEVERVKATLTADGMPADGTDESEGADEL